MIVTKIRNHYSLWDKMVLLFLLVRTKLKYPGQRLVRQRLTIRGRSMIKLGKQLTTGVGCRLEAFISDGDCKRKIFLGDRIQFNDYVHISALNCVETRSITG